MSNEIQVFKNEEFGKVRIIGDFDNPRFCLSDVCKILELRVDKVVERIGKDTLSKVPLKTAGGIQKMYFVNESGKEKGILPLIEQKGE